MTSRGFRGGQVGVQAMRWALALLCLLAAAPVMAARVAVVLSGDSAPYQEIHQVLRAHLDGDGHETVRLYADDLTPAALASSRLAVAVGVAGAESLAALPVRMPVLAVLVPRQWYLGRGQSLLAQGGRSVSAIYIDQPFERQAELIRAAFPAARRVGVLTSGDTEAVLAELERALAAQNLALVHETVEADARLTQPLERVLSETDLLLALPDPQIFNRNTAQSLFLTSYRYRDPVVGYSSSLTRAGALLSVHSSPAEVGRQAADWVMAALRAESQRLPPPAYPRYFSVSVNDQVARSLGFLLPPAGELEKMLGGGR